MNEILISIIVPHYNSPDTLSKLLTSIGSHDDVETIVVDDRSTALVEEYDKCREAFESETVVFLSNTTERKGAGTSRNVGLEKARGKWLLFADADDYMLPNWYDTVKAYTSCNHDIVFFMPDGDQRTGRHRPFAQLIDDVNENMPWAETRLRYQFFPPWSKLIRKAMVDENQIQFGETRYSNDVLFSIKTGFYAKSVLVSNESIYFLYEQENSLTKQISFESIRIRNGVSCEAYAFLKGKISRREMNNIYLVNTPLSTMRGALKRGYGWASVKELRRQYREVKFPLINLSYDNVRRMLKKRFGKKKAKK